MTRLDTDRGPQRSRARPSDRAGAASRLSQSSLSQAEPLIPRAIANPDCAFCGGLGFYAAGIRLREVECGNCIAAFERSVTDKLTAKQIFARAGVIASKRYPNGCGSATTLADIVTEAIDEFVAAAIKARRETHERGAA